MTVIRRSRFVSLVGLLALIALQGCNRKQHIGDLELTKVFVDGPTRKLAWAAAQGDIPAIDHALADGANPNAKGLYDITPLCWAVYAGNSHGVSRLLEKGANPNVQPDSSSSSMAAAAKYLEPTILCLLIIETRVIA
jgi:ankyrin repeat protein